MNELNDGNGFSQLSEGRKPSVRNFIRLKFQGDVAQRDIAFQEKIAEGENLFDLPNIRRDQFDLFVECQHLLGNTSFVIEEKRREEKDLEESEKKKILLDL